MNCETSEREVEGGKRGGGRSSITTAQQKQMRRSSSSSMGKYLEIERLLKALTLYFHLHHGL